MGRFLRIASVKEHVNCQMGKIIIMLENYDSSQLQSFLPEDFELSVSEGTLGMLMNPKANKRDALKTVCQRLGVTPEQTVTFGDDLVDIGMMRFSGHSIAVANSNPEVLRIADEVCLSNNEDGVARWIEDHLLA